MPRGRPFGDTWKRFWSRVEKTDTCWLWNSCLDAKGYPLFSVGRRTVRAHRYLYMRLFGTLVETQRVCHRCDVRRCVRPSHLFQGSDVDNMQDASQKGRMARGERHHNAKFTTAQICAMRERYAAGDRQTEIARAYTTSPTVVRRIVQRKAWKHVP